MPGSGTGNQDDGVGVDRFLPADGADSLAGLGLDIDPVFRNCQQFGQSGSNGRFQRGEFGAFGVDGAVQIANLPAATANFRRGRFQKGGGVGSLPAGIRVGKPFANVAESERSQQGVGDRVEQDVGVAMPVESELVLDPDPSQNQRPTLTEPVSVMAQPDANFHDIDFLPGNSRSCEVVARES